MIPSSRFFYLTGKFLPGSKSSATFVSPVQSLESSFVGWVFKGSVV